MDRHQRSLVARREELVGRSTTQRAALIQTAAPLLRKAEALDRNVQRVRRYPVVTALGAAAVMLLGSRKIFEIAARAFTLYALLRR
jgi:hypothetical protein